MVLSGYGIYKIGYGFVQEATTTEHSGIMSTLSQMVKGKDRVLTLSEGVPLFENGSSRLMPESEKILAQLVPEMKETPEQFYLIIGHSDNTGVEANNITLSTERASVIRDWLVLKTGLPITKFIIEGAGSSRPVASNDTQKGRALNHRVEIIPLSAPGSDH